MYKFVHQLTIGYFNEIAILNQTVFGDNIYHIFDIINIYKSNIPNKHNIQNLLDDVVCNIFLNQKNIELGKRLLCENNYCDKYIINYTEFVNSDEILIDYTVKQVEVDDLNIPKLILYNKCKYSLNYVYYNFEHNNKVCKINLL